MISRSSYPILFFVLHIYIHTQPDYAPWSLQVFKNTYKATKGKTFVDIIVTSVNLSAV